MLVCNVSQAARRRIIAADIAEAAAALDTTTQGHVVFAALVDDPANVLDRVDAYLGEIMLEAATATSTVNAGLVYAVAVVEGATATDVAIGAVPSVYAVSIAEAAAASASQDAAAVAAVAANYALAAARAGMHSVIVQPAAGKTQIISDIGAVQG